MMERCNVCATTMLDEQYFVERRPLSNGLLVHEANRSLLRLRHEKKKCTREERRDAVAKRVKPGVLQCSF